MISKLLIANRGEIVIRIIKACRDLGIETVAIYSDADKYAPHTKEATQAHYIGPSLPPKSYLNIDAIMHAAEVSAADAVHPGYGFLAETTDFPEAVLSKGMVWVGPPPDVMRVLQSKCYCRQIAQKVGVPVVAGSLNKCNQFKFSKGGIK